MEYGPSLYRGKGNPDEFVGVRGLPQLSQQRGTGTGCGDREQILRGTVSEWGNYMRTMSWRGRWSCESCEAVAGAARNAICMQCHFEGTVAVQQPGKQLYQFQPGEQLTDYVHYFLLSGNQPQKPEALSQFEALSLSECKSGNRGTRCGAGVAMIRMRNRAQRRRQRATEASV